MKSERLKKLESELQDLAQWLKLGLVPKKDLEKHKSEIETLRDKIEEEKERLKFLKENNTIEQYTPHKKGAHGRQAFADTSSLPDIEVSEEGVTDAGLDMDSESFEADSAHGEDSEASAGGGSVAGEDETVFMEDDDDEDDEDPFSDRNRWKRGIMEDPDADNW